MIHINVVHGDFYHYVMKERFFTPIFELERTVHSIGIRPIDVFQYNAEELDLMVRWATIKSTNWHVVWYIQFSGTDEELDSRVDIFCELMVKHFNNRTGESCKLTIFSDVYNERVFNRLKKKLLNITGVLISNPVA
ncbi:MAG: hypothetical protein WDZ40_01030 [Candidatus Spechtbacterales bacterium]